MSTPSWKSKHIIPLVYLSCLDKKKFNSPTKIVLFRRNLVLTQSLHKNLFVANTTIGVYNGYDVFQKEILEGTANHNVGALVSTRETRVVHKVKLTKQAKKNLQAKKNKKGNTQIRKPVKKKNA